MHKKWHKAKWNSQANVQGNANHASFRKDFAGYMYRHRTRELKNFIVGEMVLQSNGEE